jgi:hypothetical protein
MSKKRCHILADKSVAAAIAAIEVYNKPSSPYREEDFAILMINAWELLLKARWLQLNGNQLKSLHVLEPKLKANGQKTKRKYPKTNRSGNKMTIGLNRAADLLRQHATAPLPPEVVANIVLLEEIRDNAIHFHNHHMGVSARLQEIGTASLKNYVYLANEWFDVDFSEHNFFLMPLSFQHEADIVQSFSILPVRQQIANLMAFLAATQKEHAVAEEGEYSVALRMETRFVKAASPDAIKVQVTKDVGATKILISEEDALKKFPLTYDVLVNRFKTRYSDFKANGKFHDWMRQFKKQATFCRIRLLDPTKPDGARKAFFSDALIAEFDKIYTRKAE